MLHHQLEEIFQEVFQDDDLKLTDDMAAKDIPEWDSVAHVSLMFSIEEAFGIKFNSKQLGQMKNIGELKALIETKRQ